MGLFLLSIDFLTHVLVAGSKGGRSVGSDITRTSHSGRSAAHYPSDVHHHHRLGRPMATHQGPRSSQSLRYTRLSQSSRTGRAKQSIEFSFDPYRQSVDPCQRLFTMDLKYISSRTIVIVVSSIFIDTTRSKRIRRNRAFFLAWVERSVD